MIRFGGPVEVEDVKNPEVWVEAHQKLGYSAAYAPSVTPDETDLIRDFRQAASKANLVIAEVGAWSNPMSLDKQVRDKAMQHCKTQLSLAEALGARCCVNIAGSMGETWDGPHPDFYKDDTFALIVDQVREIIDAVNPKQTSYGLEMMPWMLPDSADSYLALIKAIDRDAFAVHLDPVNIVVSPRIIYNTKGLLDDLFSKLGPKIKSCHAKDITIANNLTLHLDEVRPGLGRLDFAAYLRHVDSLNDVPLMLEHLPSLEEYKLAADYVRSVAEKSGIEFVS